MKTPKKGMALCLSGGGYRAMLFHCGVLWRLNDTGLLRSLRIISSVSGGSITAGVLGKNWSALAFDRKSGISPFFEEKIVSPLRALAGSTIDVPSVLKGLVLPGSAPQYLARIYNDRLFGDMTLQDLPAAPRFVFNTTNVMSGVLCRFTRQFMWDYRVGQIPAPEFRMADVIAASSAFPPFLSPHRIKVTPEMFRPGTGTDLQRSPFTDTLVLTDGGVYDNLGLETAGEFETVIISDAGLGMEHCERPRRDWLFHLLRVINIMDNQVRSLRKRRVLGNFLSEFNRGAYFSIRSDIRDYRAKKKLPCSREKTETVAGMKTRLGKTDRRSQEHLINWGYAICDAAVRAYIDAGLPAPAKFPYPESPL